MLRSLPVLAALVSTAALCNAQTISEIVTPTVPMSVIDLNLLTPGATTLGAINAVAAPAGGMIAGFTPTPSGAAPGIWSTNASANGLGFVGGVPTILSIPAVTAFDANNVQVDLMGPSLEVGFGIGDWIGPVIIDFYLGGVLQTTFTSTTYSTAAIKYFQMTGSMFDRFDVRASTTGGNWAFGNFEIQLIGGNFATKTPYGEGCNEEFASFYESHTAFDLSNTSLSMTNTGSGYVVIAGANPVVPPTGSPIAMGDDVVIPFPLGWTLPYPGGTTTDLYVSSNGFVHLVTNTSSGCCSFNLTNFLNTGPIFAAKWDDLNPSAGGTVTFESNPVAGTATVTFDQVPDYGSATNVNTFQYAFDASGTVELRFGTCAATPGGTGWSPGAANLNPGSIDLSTTPVIVTGANDIFPLELTADARPVIGTTVTLTVDQVPAGTAIGAVIYGLTKHDPGIDLTSFGMPGCFQFTSQDAVALSVSPAGTSFTNQFAIPNDPGLAGVNIKSQGAIFNPGGNHNALDALSSNGIDFGLDIN